MDFFSELSYIVKIFWVKLLVFVDLMVEFFVSLFWCNCKVNDEFWVLFFSLIGGKFYDECGVVKWVNVVFLVEICCDFVFVIFIMEVFLLSFGYGFGWFFGKCCVFCIVSVVEMICCFDWVVI